MTHILTSIATASRKWKNMDRFSFWQVDLASVNRGKRAEILLQIYRTRVQLCGVTFLCVSDANMIRYSEIRTSGCCLTFFSHSIVHCISFMQRFTKGWQLFLQIKFFSSTGYRRIRWSRQLKSMLEVFPFQESSIRCCNMKPLKCSLHELPFVCPVDL